MLGHYGRHFNCVELNPSFYHTPTVETVSRWRDQVPAGFHFCPKLPKAISHADDLTHAARLNLPTFLRAAHAFGPTLGPVFMQLPPEFGPERLDELETFLNLLPNTLSLHVEFRNEAWFQADSSPLSEACTMLAQFGVGTVITDVAGRRDVCHMQLSTPSALIRFVGNALHATDYTRADAWVDRLTHWLAHGVGRIYFLIHQPDEVMAPEFAHYLIGQLNTRLAPGLQRPLPKLRPQATQTRLF